MKTRSFFQILVILAAIIVVVLSWTVWRPEPRPTPLPTIPVTDTPPSDTSSLFYPEKMQARFELTESGSVRLSGSVPFPDIENGCYDLKMLSPTVSDDGSRVGLRFRTEVLPLDKCASEREKGTWVTAIKASEDAEFTADFNWKPVPLTITGR